MSQPLVSSLPETAVAYRGELIAALDQVQVQNPDGTVATEILLPILQKWRADEALGELDHVYHVLEQDYTASQLSARGLVSRDLSLVQALNHVAGEAGFSLFLAVVWKLKEPGQDGAYDASNRRWGSYYVDYEDTFDAYDEHDQVIGP